MASRMTQEEDIARTIVRALRRDPVANGSSAWRPWVRWIADRIEQDKIKITVVKEET